MGRKALELVQGEEISRDTSIDAAGIDNHVLGALIWKHGVAFPSGLVIPLVVMGIALGARRTRAHALLLVALAAQALFVLAFFVTTRYRLPLITAALPYAACGIVALAELIRRRRVPRGRELAALVLAAGMLPLSNHDVQATPTTHAAFELDHLGHRLHEAGDRDGAVRQWRRALQVDPGHARAHFALARDDARRDQLDAAADHYRAGLAIAPDTYVARVGYAEILLRQERRAEAAEELRRVLKQTSAPRVRSVVCMVARKYRIELDGC
jgi:tetratricopeptide (TPR) repeat protein